MNAGSMADLGMGGSVFMRALVRKVLDDVEWEVEGLAS